MDDEGANAREDPNSSASVTTAASSGKEAQRRRRRIYIRRRPHGRDYVGIRGNLPGAKVGIILPDDSMAEKTKRSASYKEAVANGLIDEVRGSGWVARLPTCNDNPDLS